MPRQSVFFSIDVYGVHGTHPMFNGTLILRNFVNKTLEYNLEYKMKLRNNFFAIHLKHTSFWPSADAKPL
jgi:hypothetical protein